MALSKKYFKGFLSLPGARVITVSMEILPSQATLEAASKILRNKFKINNIILVS
jgi:hypothetical protein